MKKVLKINFCDFWSDFNYEENLFLNLLAPYYEVRISENPEVLFYSCFGFNHLKYTCYKIFYTGENIRPDHKECDYSLTFDYDDYRNKNLRVPFYRWKRIEDLINKKKDPEQIIKAKTKFCCTVVSNPNGTERNRFFGLLSKYKKIDSGGRYLNNIGYSVKNKMEFLGDYKFVFSFENSSYPGYTTEKIVEAMLMNSLPIYWGNPLIERDFNLKSFISLHQYTSFEAAVKEIIRIDKDESLYRKYIEQPYFSNNEVPESLRLDYMARELHEKIECFSEAEPVSKKFRNRVYGKLLKQKKLLASRFCSKF